MRFTTLSIAVAATSILCGCSGGGGNDAPQKTVLAAIGDSPYGTSPTDTAQFDVYPQFIAAINADADVSLVLHAGDTHSGKQYCTEAYNQSIYDLWTSFKAPLVYTPGDNEWADCHKSKEGGGSYNAATGSIAYVVDGDGQLVDYAGGDPLANLQLVRSIFFANPEKAFGGTMDVHSQADEYDTAHPADNAYAENVWFERGGALVVSVNIPGGSNNGTDPWYGAPSMSPAQQQDVAGRTAAALRWIDYAFKTATDHKDQAVLILTQADMWDLDGKAATHIAGYAPYLDKIAALTAGFGKPVLLINGDSHGYRSDNPLKSGAACVTEDSAAPSEIACTDDAYANQSSNRSSSADVENFHRLVVHGSSAPMEWLKLSIDPAANAAASDDKAGSGAFGPFSWTRKPTNLPQADS
ncbi:metallophosphoesterase [Solimonas flava]|uniref:metallophosphoesterase n=1 Tax=Solimonas flava TaxID=415849 RepID=UPI00041458AB|nr:metallophosphoesterase [Solimonas flava]